MEIFKVIVGSQSYGTAIETSDTDYKAVYRQPTDDILGIRYQPQKEHDKDSVAYEVRRFLELLCSANPTVLEMLYAPEKCILHKEPCFDLIWANRDKFLTKKCRQSFGGYAVAQISKARGLDKKMNWEKSKITKKVPQDFCHIIEGYKTYPLDEWLAAHNLTESDIGLIHLDRAPGCFAVFAGKRYKGLFAACSDAVMTSSIPKDEPVLGILSYNRDAYRMHRKDWDSYQEWLENRNETRYVDVARHDQKIDGKHMLHCRRLLNMAMEIPRDKTIHVWREDAADLLAIRRGEVDLASIITAAEADIKSLDTLYAESDLPDDVEKDFLHELLLEVRKA